MTPSQTTAAPIAERKPRDDEIDVYGVTHTGKLRKENQDHFLICALKKQMVVHQTSLAQTHHLIAEPERLAFLMMVADGVGGGNRGADASRMALEAVMQYVIHSRSCYYAAGSKDDGEFYEALKQMAHQCHSELVRRGEEDPAYRGMATTLTLYLGLWPRAYLLQVGDSRCYHLRNNELTQITRDQTMAQELVDLGVIPPSGAQVGRLANTLSSSIGGSQTAPVVSRLDNQRGNTVLLCSDGLTKHVPDERIRDRLRSMTSARQACKDLLKDALAGGGSDNITLIVGRALP
ncbi:MAG TPA: protein phosphatase 2C domain-containing protein, partial [Gemmatimonadales bacterium]|nr:protein phosphatase 2C domain-containing protein [Gemmatimonadales bacterium]